MHTLATLQHPTETIETAHGPCPVVYAVEQDEATRAYTLTWGMRLPSGDYEAIDVVGPWYDCYDDAATECAIWANSR